MKRRAALAALAALAAAPRAGWPQRVHRIGTLVHGPEKAWTGRVTALRAGLAELGYVEGRNCVFLSRWNEGNLERLAEVAAELLREKPDVVVCAPVLSAAALHKLSGTVPIVVGTGAGSVKIGLAKNFAQPGGNVTGLETQAEEIHSKQLELLKLAAPKVSRVAVLNTGRYLFHDEAWQAIRQAAPRLKVELIDMHIGKQRELPQLEASCGKGGCNGLYVMSDPNLVNWSGEIIALAARLRLPAVYPQVEYALAGGMLSYSANFEEMWRRSATYVDRILKGAKPGELPIERPSRFEMVINLKTAKALGLAVRDDLLARADRVIR